MQNFSSRVGVNAILRNLPWAYNCVVLPQCQKITTVHTLDEIDMNLNSKFKLIGVPNLIARSNN